MDHAAVTVTGVLAEADVSDEDKLLRGCGLPDSAQTLLHDAVFVPGAGGVLVFSVGQAEEQKACDAEARCFFGFAHGFIDGEVKDARHGGDGVADALAGTDKERIDEVARIEHGFTDECAERFGSPQPPQPIFGKTHEWIVVQGRMRGDGAAGAHPYRHRRSG